MPKITLSGSAELLSIIPFQLGFAPIRSVVIVCFHGRRLGMIARLDAVPQAHAATAASQLVATLLGEAPTSVAVVGFEERAGETMPLSDSLAAALALAHIDLRERIVVRDGRWFGLGCDCCPAEGTLLPDPSRVPAVADFVALGRSVLDGRDALETLVAPLDPTAPRHDLLAQAIGDWQDRYDWAGTDEAVRALGGVPAAAAVAGDHDGTGSSSAREFLVEESLVAWGGLLRGELVGLGLEHWVPALVGVLRDLTMRDALIAWVCPGTPTLARIDPGIVDRMEVLLGPETRSEPVVAAEPPCDSAEETRRLAAALATDWESADAHRFVQSRLEGLCRLTPAAHAAPLLSVVASFAWWCGDGARARVAAELALRLEPDHRLSRLIVHSLDHGLRPRVPA